MYDESKYLTVKEACTFLGLGRNSVLKLCQDGTHGFPAVKVGNRYHIDGTMLEEWKADWFARKFTL